MFSNSQAHPQHDPLAFLPKHMNGHAQDEILNLFSDAMQDTVTGTELISQAGSRHVNRMIQSHQLRAQTNLRELYQTWNALPLAKMDAQSGLDNIQSSFNQWAEYAHDAWQRWVLTADILRERGNIFIQHEQAGCPPVLIYDYEIVVDGATLTRPCNYLLLRIIPPEGIAVDDNKRPYIIIDPRAGHGGGIGGFKTESQVGVALASGFPVYFVSFRRDPVPSQSLADVTRAEAIFVRTVMERHPNSEHPVVIGNCQGGWAALVLAATNIDLPGPIVLNGAPVDTWAGEVGVNPMRYNAGVFGGTWVPMWLADMGAGLFDGAHLVQNFEMLNPSRNYFSKYYDIFTNPERGRERFLNFERWWGGFFLLTEAEIHWIVEQLFIGNRLVRNEAQIERGCQIDIKRVRSPIIVFASRGDNITPPAQALNWIVNSYTNVDEIRIRGQRIIYMVHEEIGHLGIFVSSKVAKKEHKEMASTMEMIEALPPGLYEMQIEHAAGEGFRREFTVSFEDRDLDDIRGLGDGTRDETGFPAIARLSELQAELYDIFCRPWVKFWVSPYSAEFVRELHPLRLQRSMCADQNPWMLPLKFMAQTVHTTRKPCTEDNPFLIWEKVMAHSFEQLLDIGRDLGELMREMTFFSLWGMPWAKQFSKDRQQGRALRQPEDWVNSLEVQTVLRHMHIGGFTEGVVRMMVLLAKSRGEVRRDRLARISGLIVKAEPFCSIPVKRRADILHEQTLIVAFAEDQAIATLGDLLKEPHERELALKTALFITGSVAELSTEQKTMFDQICHALNLPEVSEDVTDNPLVMQPTDQHDASFDKQNIEAASDDSHMHDVMAHHIAADDVTSH